VETIDEGPVRFGATANQFSDGHGRGRRVTRRGTLDVDADWHIPVPGEIENGLQAGDSQTVEATAKPTAGVESLEFLPGEVPCVALSVRRLLQGPMHHRQATIATQLDVALDEFGSEVHGASKRVKRVFGNVCRLTTMGNGKRPPISPPWIGFRAVHRDSFFGEQCHLRDIGGSFELALSSGPIWGVN
jgi:hypothetical protein